MPAGHTLLLAAPRAMGRPKARHNDLRADEQVANRVLGVFHRFWARSSGTRNACLRPSLRHTRGLFPKSLMSTGAGVFLSADPGAW